MKCTAVVLMMVCALTAAAQGTICTPETLKGSWGVTCHGYMPAGPAAMLVPASLLGTCSASVGAYFSCEATGSVGGLIVNQGMNGQAVVQDGCTGTIKYAQTINGRPAGDVNIRFLILKEGTAMKGLVTDPGVVLQCSLYRIGM